MKQQILDALRTRFAGVSEAILGRIADKLAKTITEADGVKDAVEAVTFQQVLESYGDSRATEAQRRMDQIGVWIKLQDETPQVFWLMGQIAGRTFPPKIWRLEQVTLASSFAV